MGTKAGFPPPEVIPVEIDIGGVGSVSVDVRPKARVVLVLLAVQDGFQEGHARGDSAIGALLQVIFSEEKPQLIQFLQPFLRLFYLFLTDFSQPDLQLWTQRIDKISEKMEVETLLEGIQFDTGKEFQDELRSQEEPLFHVIHRVVVGKSNGPEAFLPGHLKNLPGGMLAVRRSVGVDVQVNHRLILIRKGIKVYS
jgi:hypothetical protein